MFAIFADPRRRSTCTFGPHGEEPARTAGRSGPRCSCCSSPASRPPTGPRRGATRSTRRAGWTSSPRPRNPGGNMEGKEVRFGIANSALYATVTTDASCGAVNAMHDSFTPLGGLVPLRQHPARRGDLRRRGRRALRHAGDGGADRLHRRAHGGAHARVPRQEDPGPRDPDGDALRADLPGCRSSRSPALSVVLPAGPQGPQQRRAARAVRDPLRLHLDAGQQRQRLRRPHRHRPTTTTRCSAWPC